MRRLTPDKIYGYALPKARRINRGNTSIIYETADPCRLEVFTIEYLKMEWWQHGLEIIDSYEEVCTAHYSGYQHGAYSAIYKRFDLPVYRCLVERLDAPDREQMRRIRSIQRQISRLTVPYNENARIYRLNRWQAIADLAIPEITVCVDFISNYGHEDVYPDFGTGDFMIKAGEIVCLDPFHHCDLSAALRLTDYHE